MILGINELYKLVKEKNLVEGLCEREMNSPEGAGFDLRMGEVFEPSGNGFLGVEERGTPATKLLAKHDPTKPQAEIFFTFEPQRYYLVKTIEKVNLPTTLSGIIFPRTTMFRSGLALFNGIVQPGYQGQLTFGICNLGTGDIKVALSARVAHIIFCEVLGSGNQYRGQWQGGRVATNGKETQI